MSSARGHARERAVRQELEKHGYWTARAAGSLGDADVIALKADHDPLMIEVKSTAGGPFERFGPAERQTLLDAAERAGATPLLAYWPPRGKLRWISAAEWPQARRAAQVFPLTPNEAVFFDQLGRWFPGWREVTEGASGTETSPPAAGAGDTPAAPSVTSHQSPLFDNSREAA